jgi:hypothetical protein
VKFKLNIVVSRPNHGGTTRDVIYHKFEEPTIPQGIDRGKAAVESERKEIEADGGKIVDVKLHLVQLVWRLPADL